jgi:hypothetical protein
MSYVGRLYVRPKGGKWQDLGGAVVDSATFVTNPYAKPLKVPTQTEFTATFEAEGTDGTEFLINAGMPVASAMTAEEWELARLNRRRP